LEASGTPLGVLAVMLAEDLDIGVRSALLVREFRATLKDLSVGGGVEDELAELLGSGAALGD
jgi:hypothetical protein